MMSANIKDVAERANVSISTVSRVMNGSKRVSPQLKVKVEKAIEELNYSANSIARGLKNTRTNKIAVIVTALSRSFFTTVLEGISKEAERNGYSIIIAETHDSIEREIQLVESFASQWVDGIILASSAYGKDRKTKKYIAGLDKYSKKDSRIPVITLEFPLDNEHVDAVVIDHEKASYDAVKYLINEVGRKNIIQIAIPFEHYLSKERVSGYKRALAEAGLPVLEENILEGDYTTYSGFNLVKGLIKEKRKFDALFCANDQMAVGAIKACEEMNVRIPEDVAIIGNDDIFVASIVTPSLSSIRIPKFELGATAMKRMIEIIENGEEVKTGGKIVLSYEIVERETTVKGLRNSLEFLQW